MAHGQGGAVAALTGRDPGRPDRNRCPTRIRRAKLSACKPPVSAPSHV